MLMSIWRAAHGRAVVPHAPRLALTFTATLFVIGAATACDGPGVLEPSPDMVEETAAPSWSRPHSITDLQVLGVTDTSVTLGWTEVDDGTGEPARYAIRAGSPKLIWGKASADARYVNGKEIGSTRILVWDGLDASTHYEFRVLPYRETTEGTTYGKLSDVVAADTEADLPAVTAVSASPSSATLPALGATLEISPTAYAPDGSSVEVQWVWSNLTPEVVSLAGGIVTAEAPGDGRVVVSAACCTAADTVQLTVDPRPDVVDLDPDSVDLEVGEADSLVVQVFDANGHPIPDADVTFSTSDSTIASVDSAGVVRAVAQGTARIRASTGTVVDSIPVEVDAAVSAPATVKDLEVRSVTETTVTLRWTDVDDGAGEPASYAVRMGSPSIEWGSASSSARYLTGGTIGADVVYAWDGLEPGTVYEFQVVSYRDDADGTAYGALSNIAQATTDEPLPAVTEVVVSPATVTLEAGAAGTMLEATAYGPDGSAVSAELEWSSADASVATVDPTGLVTPLAEGVASIRVRARCCAAQAVAEVYVVAPERTDRDPWFESVWDFPDIGSLDASAAFNVSADRPVVQLVRDVSGLPWAGSNYVRINFVADGEATQTGGIRAFPPLADTERPRELWVEVWVRFSEDFMVARGGDHKTMFLLESGRTDGTRNRWELKVGAFGLDIVGQIKNGNVHTETSCIPPVGADGTAAGECPFGSPTRPDLDTFVWDGSWHRLRWHAKMASGPGAEDGAYEAWLDDTKFLESLGIATDAQTGAWFDDIALGRNLDQPLPAPQTLDWGQFRVYTQNPGW